MRVSVVPPLVPVGGRQPRRSYGILSTFTPTPCGLATFSAALARELSAVASDAVGIVRIADDLSSVSDARVVCELENGSARSIAAAAETLSCFDVAIVQHEYGIYGGSDGDEVLDVLSQLCVPSIVILHTVVHQPTAHQRFVLEAVADAASVVVVMTNAARERLCRLYDVDVAKVVTIPHGAATPTPVAGDRRARPVLLTWGLLGRGKGIEWVIDAMAQLHDLRTRPRYVVAGRTHPKVLAAEGEAYRNMLIQRTWNNGVAASVTFDPSYRDLAALTQMVREAAIVVLPYDSRDQVTSGVLVDAVAAGRPVVATAFPHAVELLSSGAGLVVPHGDPAALAEALRRVLTEPGLATSMAAEAARLAPELGWTAVAAQYVALAEHLLTDVQAVAG